MMPDPPFSSKQNEGRWADQAKLRGSFDPPARMREYGNVNIPQEAFIPALRMGEE